MSFFFRPFPTLPQSTAATVIAKSKGFEVIEFNASDVRNKKVRSISSTLRAFGEDCTPSLYLISSFFLLMLTFFSLCCLFVALPQSLEAVVGDITGNRGLGEFFAKAPANNNAAASSSSSASSGLRPAGKTVIIMDEVDGMGGNEVSDGGGKRPALFVASAEAHAKHVATHPLIFRSLCPAVLELLPLRIVAECRSWWRSSSRRERPSSVSQMTHRRRR